MSEQGLFDKVEAVNAVLLSQEPKCISFDAYAKHSGYKPQYIIDAMNSVFGIGAWGFEELSNEIVPAESAVLIIAQVRVWLAGSDFQPTGWGQARITKGDVGDAKKGAQTDAFKKACSYFSIGNRAYQGLLPQVEESGRGTQQQSQTQQN